MGGGGVSWCGLIGLSLSHTQRRFTLALAPNSQPPTPRPAKPHPNSTHPPPPVQPLPRLALQARDLDALARARGRGSFPREDLVEDKLEVGKREAAELHERSRLRLENATLAVEHDEPVAPELPPKRASVAGGGEEWSGVEWKGVEWEWGMSESAVGPPKRAGKGSATLKAKKERERLR